MTETLETKTVEEILAVVSEVAAELEKHIPASVEHGWIICGCGNSVRPLYWTRHSTGADGSAIAPRKLNQLLPE